MRLISKYCKFFKKYPIILEMFPLLSSLFSLPSSLSPLPRQGVSQAPSNALLPPMRGHTGTVRTARFSPPLSGSGPSPFVASAGAGDFCPRIWDVGTGSCLASLSALHTGVVQALLWLDATTFTTADEKGGLVGWDSRIDTHTWNVAAPEGISFCSLALLSPWASSSPPFCPIVAGCSRGTVMVLDPRKIRPFSSLVAGQLHQDDVRSLTALPSSFSFSGRGQEQGQPGAPLFATASFDGTAAVWALQGQSFVQRALLQGAHTDKVLGVASVSGGPSGQLVTTGADGRVVLWTL